MEMQIINLFRCHQCGDTENQCLIGTVQSPDGELFIAGTCMVCESVTAWPLEDEDGSDTV